ncbi:MAG TPA: cupin domain-containing protein [Solirubrobacterales bacterium]|jgi:mannose-6-phosphate isomerase-like protein (cupin superfamily)|nr:cupin domain-containing protein [Solirubrobacterales bacterium]HMU26604.1 cupin domain-containing protein [Solirubrobacterales bacterium]HMW46387.1 cupin domain-containing protein [Solirubrobacterales bacterium]HMX70976.1 cupin domain-containing protein [Solirubrobacterales bacterium]HMY26411.1 cupin domain-containing protein [Solirubrobacterales bacterium]
MTRVGQAFDNPVTGERVVVLTDPFEHPDRVLAAHLTVAPGGRVAMAHIHPAVRERFHVLGGQVGFLVGDEEVTLGPGESAEVPAGVVHDWWQIGEEEASVVVEATPGDRLSEFITSIFGLCRDGKVNEDGVPRLLQIMVMVNEYSDEMILSSPPPAIQKTIAAMLAPIGRLRGLKPSYPEYTTSTETVEPAPEALALLDEDGRLKGFA